MGKTHLNGSWEHIINLIDEGVNSLDKILSNHIIVDMPFIEDKFCYEMETSNPLDNESDIFGLDIDSFVFNYYDNIEK